jgi:hypothetical protein
MQFAVASVALKDMPILCHEAVLTNVFVRDRHVGRVEYKWHSGMLRNVHLLRIPQVR